MRHSRLTLVCAALVGNASAQGYLFDLVGDSGINLGNTVSMTSDVDGDGTSDIIAGTFGSITQPGSIRIYSGASHALILTVVGMSQFDEIGWNIAVGFDIDGDGSLDFAGSDGATFVRFYRADGGQILSLTAQSTNDGFGRAISSAGDFDFDGRDDVLIGEPFHDGIAGANSGRCRIFSGATGLTLGTIDGPVAGDTLGYAVVGGIRLDNDSNPDFAIGSLYSSSTSYSQCGSVIAFSGLTQTPLWTRYGTNFGAWFGASLAVLGDATGDSIDEIVVGEPFFGQLSGRVYALSGLNGALVSRISGLPYELLGYAVAATGDLDGDAVPDYIGSSAYSDLGGTDSGIVRVASTASNAELFSLIGDEPMGLLGWQTSALGDVNGDGYMDVAVGQRNSSFGGTNSGRIRVISGVCGTAQYYGSSCAGSGGFAPSLSLTGCATPESKVGLQLSAGVGAAPWFLAIGISSFSQSMGGGCTLLTLPIITIYLGLLPGIGPGAGYATVAGTLPLSTSGLAITAQSFVVDNAAPAGFTATNGVAFAIK